MTAPLVMIADDDAEIIALLEVLLKSWGYATVAATSRARMLAQIGRTPPDLVLLDLEFGDASGLDAIADLLRALPNLAVVLLTGRGGIDAAVEAIRRGAYDFLTKPPNHVRLRMTLQRALEKRTLLRRIETLAEPADSGMRGASYALTRLRETIASIAPTDVTVLIQGESGTGKELVARALHDLSRRHGAPFVPVNMAALPHELVESTLFGHEKGAFTGADRVRVGCCEAADGGTLFLDEIGEMDVEIQAKLLRFVQERQVQRVGATAVRTVDVRIVAATNRDLARQVRRGCFREDLFYRLQVVPLEVPPLRERRGDVALLAVHFLARAAARHHRDVLGFSPEALDRLAAYHWPGNIRQLENMVERLVVLCRGPEITTADLPTDFNATGPTAPRSHERPMPTPRSFDDMEKQTILNALQSAQGNVRDAARVLGLGQATVYRKLKVYGLKPPYVGQETAV